MLPNGFHFIEAIPRHRLGDYEKYVVEWVDGLPKCLVVVNVGVRIIYRGRRGNTEYFEAKPL